MLLAKHAVAIQSKLPSCCLYKQDLIPASKCNFKIKFICLCSNTITLPITLYSSTVLLFTISQTRLPSSSLSGRVYMPSSPPLELEGIIPFNMELKAKFVQYLATKPPTTPTWISKRRTNNRCIFSQAKKAVYRRWLEDPYGVIEGESIKAKAQDRNARFDALKFYELDQGCIYQKAPIRNGEVVGQCKYVALSTNAFDIIVDEHRGIKHFGICFPTLILYCLTNVGIEKTFQRIVVNYYSITRANVAWVIKRCNICNL